MNTPNYKRIYQDIILKKFPNKEKDLQKFMNKDNFSSMDVIYLDNLLFNNKDQDSLVFDQQHRSYDCRTILHILDYQKKNNLNSAQTAIHFNLSRSALGKWRKKYKNGDENTNY